MTHQYSSVSRTSAFSTRTLRRKRTLGRSQISILFCPKHAHAILIRRVTSTLLRSQSALIAPPKYSVQVLGVCRVPQVVYRPDREVVDTPFHHLTIPRQKRSSKERYRPSTTNSTLRVVCPTLRCCAAAAVGNKARFETMRI